MDARKPRDLPARLAGLRQRFEDWRRTHEPRSRIPTSLWGSAVKMAGVYGLNRTARALRLDYYALKKRVERETLVKDGTTLVSDSRDAIAAAKLKPEVVTPFLELVPPLSAGVSECLLELENAAGAKMRVHLKGVTSPDLAALSQSFWNSQP
jgi:hypothetical protein